MGMSQKDHGHGSWHVRIQKVDDGYELKLFGGKNVDLKKYRVPGELIES
jgi:hypothetical protein